MIDYLPVREADNGPLIERMAAGRRPHRVADRDRGGYYIDPATGGFDAAHPDIAHDAEHPDAPRTAFGAMVAALARAARSGASVPSRG
jgi:mannitol 2-dehydrogenase